MRRVVRGSTVRCDRCRLPLRWCVCAGLCEVRCPLRIDVLAHHREPHRPSSTGNLIRRVFPEARHHVWRRERQFRADELRVPGRELWVVHPQGGPVPDGAAPANVQVVMLDGSWGETSAMAREIVSWGRTVSLPMAGASRYWLRAQQDGGRFSTVEALMFLLHRFGLADAHDALREQFELHVYASLRSRGRKEIAAEFLAGSMIGSAFPALLAQLQVRRPQ